MYNIITLLPRLRGCKYCGNVDCRTGGNWRKGGNWRRCGNWRRGGYWRNTMTSKWQGRCCAHIVVPQLTVEHLIVCNIFCLRQIRKVGLFECILRGQTGISAATRGIRGIRGIL